MGEGWGESGIYRRNKGMKEDHWDCKKEQANYIEKIEIQKR